MFIKLQHTWEQRRSILSQCDLSPMMPIGECQWQTNIGLTTRDIKLPMSILQKKNLHWANVVRQHEAIRRVPTANQYWPKIPRHDIANNGKHWANVASQHVASWRVPMVNKYWPNYLDMILQMPIITNGKPILSRYDLTRERQHGQCQYRQWETNVGLGHYDDIIQLSGTVLESLILHIALWTGVGS